MMIIKKEIKSKKTGATITLHERDNGILRWYELECCTHGFLSDMFYKITNAKKAMSKSNEWCVGCIEGWDDNDDPA